MRPRCAQLLSQVHVPRNRQSPRWGLCALGFREGCAQGSGGEGGDRGCCSLTPGVLEREWDHRAGCSTMWSLAGGSSVGMGHHLLVKGNDWDQVGSCERGTASPQELGNGHWPIKGSAWGANSIHPGWQCLLPGGESALSYLPLATRSAPSLWGHRTHPLGSPLDHRPGV